MTRRTDPHRLTQYALDYPWLTAVASGILLALWTLVVSGDVWAAAVLGLVMTLLIAVIWRQGGPGYRWRQAILRRFPKRRP